MPAAGPINTVVAPPRVNIEQKFPCRDLAAARAAALAGGARPAGLLVQRDVFFHAPRGRLKLRHLEQDGHPPVAELIAYDRPDAPAERTSRYHVVPVAHAAPLEAALAAALGVRGEVRKRRTLLLDANLRLHLDEVEGLGDYVEFEAVLGEGVTEDDGRRQVARWRALLSLEENVPCSYIDLIAPPAVPQPGSAAAGRS